MFLLGGDSVGFPSFDCTFDAISLMGMSEVSKVDVNFFHSHAIGEHGVARPRSSRRDCKRGRVRAL